MKRDITDREDIICLVNAFYSKVKGDERIGWVFTDVMKVDWDSHLPRMYAFWEAVLLGKTSFKGNPMSKHIMVNRKERLTKQHFDRWIVLWEATINDKFTGEVAEHAKKRAQVMGQLMLYKIRASEKSNFIQ